MKLLINQDLNWVQSFQSYSREERAEAIEQLKDVKDFCRQFALSSVFDVTDESVSIRVFAQKVTLDDLAMNDLFANFLTEFFDLTLEYASLGGRGCEFSMIVKSATPSY